MSAVVTTVITVAEVTAPLTEWAMKMLVSMPAFLGNDSSYVAKVKKVIGLFGFTIIYIHNVYTMLYTHSCQK